MKARKRMYALIIVPSVILLIAFVCVPLLNGIRLSFFKWNGYSQNMKYVGFENFKKAFKDSVFWGSTKNTLIYGFGSAILQNILGLAAALFLNRKFKGRNIVRLILYMPIMISGFIMGHILNSFVDLKSGVFNTILGWFGINPVYWMETGISSTIIITLANSWQYMGVCMLIYLAGLQNIPVMYKEAAELDGAGRWKAFYNITLPLLIPSITTAFITNLINSFKMYEIIVAMSGGGPNRQSLSLSYYIQLLYFGDEKAGYASAVGILMFFIIMIITLPINSWFKTKEVEY